MQPEPVVIFLDITKKEWHEVKQPMNNIPFSLLIDLSDSYLNNYSVLPEKVSGIANEHIQYGKMMKVTVGNKQAIQQLEKQKAATKPFRL